MTGPLTTEQETALRDALATIPEPQRTWLYINLPMGDQSPLTVAECIADVVDKAIPYGTTEDGDTWAYLVPKGAMHRLVGACRSSMIPAHFRADAGAAS